MKDIDVRMENGTLTIRGERKFEAKKEDGGWHPRRAVLRDL
jgi:HSP20 family molecular chaperone IbpA